jgi:hypothetical protein
MSCKRQTSRKYTSRPSPAFPANHAECRGTTKRGKYGKMYVSRADSRGVYSWKPMVTAARSRSRSRKTLKPRRTRKTRKPKGGTKTSRRRSRSTSRR